MTVENVDYTIKIPNNVNLSDDKALQRALEHWLPNYLTWWREMGPEATSARQTLPQCSSGMRIACMVEVPQKAG